MSWLHRIFQRSEARALTIVVGVVVFAALAFSLQVTSKASGPVVLTVLPWDSSAVANIRIYAGHWPSSAANDGSIAGAELVAEGAVPAGSAYRGRFRLKPGDYTVSASPSVKGKQEHVWAIPSQVHITTDTQILLYDCSRAGAETIVASPAVPYSVTAMGAGRGPNAFVSPCLP